MNDQREDLKGTVHHGVRLYTPITISSYILKQGGSSFLPQKAAAS